MEEGGIHRVVVAGLTTPNPSPVGRHHQLSNLFLCSYGVFRVCISMAYWSLKLNGRGGWKIGAQRILESRNLGSQCSLEVVLLRSVMYILGLTIRHRLPRISPGIPKRLPSLLFWRGVLPRLDLLPSLYGFSLPLHESPLRIINTQNSPHISPRCSAAVACLVSLLTRPFAKYSPELLEILRRSMHTQP